MKMVYVGADVHQTSTTLVALDHEGSVIKKSLIRTTPENVIREVQALGKHVKFAVEESNHSRWVYEALRSVAHEVIVCDPKRNKFGDEVNKNDAVDALGLAELNYMGKLKPIYHGEAVHTDLKELVKAYNRSDKRRTSAMSAIRGVFANEGKWSGSSALFTTEGRAAWLQAVEGDGRRLRLEQLYAEFDLANELKGKARKAMLATARKHDGWRSVFSVPGIGQIRTAQILGTIGTPCRFRGKRQLWSYAGFAVVHRTTDDYDERLQRKRRTRTLGLNRNRNPVLKDAFKGASKSVLLHRDKYPEIAAYFERRAQEKGADIAAVVVARKLAAITLTLWKRKEVYDPEKANW